MRVYLTGINHLLLLLFNKAFVFYAPLFFVNTTFHKPATYLHASFALSKFHNHTRVGTTIALNTRNFVPFFNISLMLEVLEVITVL